jgi:hypothetical protein
LGLGIGTALTSPLSFDKESGSSPPQAVKTLEKDSSRLAKMTKAEKVTARLHPVKRFYDLSSSETEDENF